MQGPHTRRPPDVQGAECLCRPGATMSHAPRTLYRAQLPGRPGSRRHVVPAVPGSAGASPFTPTRAARDGHYSLLLSPANISRGSLCGHRAQLCGGPRGSESPGVWVSTKQNAAHLVSPSTAGGGDRGERWAPLSLTTGRSDNTREAASAPLDPNPGPAPQP